MSDLCKRLGEFQIETSPGFPIHPDICDEAKSEIERLQMAIGTEIGEGAVREQGLRDRIDIMQNGFNQLKGELDLAEKIFEA